MRAKVGGDLGHDVEEQVRLVRRHFGEGVDVAIAGKDLRGFQTGLGLIGSAVDDAQLREQPKLDDLLQHPDVAHLLGIGQIIHGRPGDQGQRLVRPPSVVQQVGFGAERREMDRPGLGVRRSGGRSGRQGAKGGRDGLGGALGRDVADHGHLDRTRAQGTLDEGLHVVRLGLGQVDEIGLGPARVVVMQQQGQLQLHDPGRRGEEPIDLRARRGAGALESLGPPARIGDIGGHQLHLGVQVHRPGRAGEVEPVVAGREGDAVGLGVEDGLDVLETDRLQAAQHEPAPVDSPARGLVVLRHVEQAIADLDADQHLVGAELGLFDGQADTVGEVDEMGAQVADETPVDDLPRRAERGVRPGSRGGVRALRDRFGLDLREGGFQTSLAPLQRDRMGHENQRPRALKGGSQSGCDLIGGNALERGLDDGEVLGGAGEDLPGFRGGQKGAGQSRCLASRGRGYGGLVADPQSGRLAVDLRLGDTILNRLAAGRFGGLQGVAPALRVAADAEKHDPCRAQQIAPRQQGVLEGSLGAVGQRLQPPVDDGQGQPLKQILARDRHGGGGRLIGRDPGDHGGARQIGIDDQSALQPPLRRRTQRRVLPRRPHAFPVGEPRLDPGLDLARIDVADHDQRGALGAVIGVVEVADQRDRGVLDDVDLADRIAIDRPLVLQEEIPLGLGGAIIRRVAQPLLPQDGAALGVHGRLAEGQFAGDFADPHQAEVDGGGLGVGQVQLIEGLRLGGVGAGVGADRHA